MYEAIRALEQVGVLSWVNRIKRVREYVPRPVRQPGATTLRGAAVAGSVRPGRLGAQDRAGSQAASIEAPGSGRPAKSSSKGEL